MKIVISTLAVLVVAVAGWFFVSPLFIDEEVNEPLIATAPSRAQVDAMNPSQRDALMQKVMQEAATADDLTVNDSMEMIESKKPLVVATGRFHDADAIHKGSGNALLYRLEQGRFVVRLEDLNVTNGPALVVLLAAAKNPESADDVKRGFIRLGKLKGNVGNQNYEVPPNIRPESYGSVVIWCELFDVLFSAASMNVT